MNSVMSNTAIYNKDPDYSRLATLLKTYSVIKDPMANGTDNKIYASNRTPAARVNFVALNGGAYCIPDDKISTFFKAYGRVFIKDDIPLHIAEYQTPISGIMLDFDIMYNNEHSHNGETEFDNITKFMIKELSTMITDTEFKTTMCVLTKGNRSRPKGEYWKDGFHLVFPGIRVSTFIKNELIEKINENMEELIDDYEHVVGGTNILDTASSNVYTLIIGGMKPGGKPYEISHLRNISYSQSASGKPKVKLTTTESKITKSEFAYEFSVSHTPENTKVPRHVLTLTDTMINAEAAYVAPTQVVQVEIDSEMEEISKYINILSPQRCEDHNTWFTILCILTKLGPKYKEIARKFSTRPDTIVDGAVRKGMLRQSFEATWSQLIRNPKYSHTVGTLYWYAKEDNPTQFEVIRSSGIDAMLYNMMFDTHMTIMLNESEIARLTDRVVGHLFAASKSSSGKEAALYTFQVSDPGPSQFKWVENTIKRIIPRSIDRFLADILPKKMRDICTRLTTHMNNLRDAETADTDQIKAVNSQRTKLEVLAKKMGSSAVKHSSYSEFINLKYNPNFAKLLDSDAYIFGVGNGVLELPAPTKVGSKHKIQFPRLVMGVHDYKISKYTEVCYRAPESKSKTDHNYERRVFNIVREMFPEDEGDAFVYILFYMSTMLVGGDKSPLLLCLVGPGGNGKSIIFSTLLEVIGDGSGSRGYGAKVPVTIFAEVKNQDPNSATAADMLLNGPRGVVLSESSNGAALGGGPLKQKLGSEPLVGRKLYGDMVNFNVQATFMSGNNFAFKVEDPNDYAIWRRLKQYNMKHTFLPPHRFDETNPFHKRMDVNIERSEKNTPEFKEAFLSILVKMYTILCNEYNGDVANVPCSTIDRETEDYRRSQDLVSAYIVDNLARATPRTAVRYPLIDIAKQYVIWHDITYEKKSHNIQVIMESLAKSDVIKDSIESNGRTKFLVGHRIMDIINGDAVINASEQELSAHAKINSRGEYLDYTFEYMCDKYNAYKNE